MGVKLIKISGFLSLFIGVLFTISFESFGQINNLGLSLWLKADSIQLSGDSVNVWYDLSGNTNNPIALHNTNRPVIINQISRLNNYPALHFDGIDDYLSFNEISDIRTIFFLVRHSTGTSSIYPCLLGHSDLYNFEGTPGNLLFSAAYASQSLINGQGFINGSAVPPASMVKPTEYSIISLITTGNVKAEHISSPRVNLEWWDGDYAEIIIYNRALSDPERIAVEQYLRNKYAPPVNIGPGITVSYGFRDTIIHAGSRFTHFQWYKNGAISTGDTLEYLAAAFPGGNYKVIVTDIFGFQSTDSVNVTYPDLNPKNLNDTTICLGNTLTWDPGLGSGYTVEWQDGTTTPVYNITQDGSYYYAITDTNQVTIYSDTINVNIDDYSVTASLGNDTSLCYGNPIFLEFGAASATNYLWSNDATTPEIAITQAGTFSVTVTDNNGCIAKDTIEIISIIGGNLSANFTVDTVCFGWPSIFTNLSSGTSYDSLLWEFGDGSMDTALSPVHLFGSPGTYNITLTLFAGTCLSTVSKQATVKPNPVADFSFTSSCIGFPVSFTNLSNANGSGVITGYSWNFAGYGNSSSTDTVFNFPLAGNHPVSLSVTSSNGCSGSITRVVNTVTSVTLPDISLVQPGNHTLVSNNPVHFSWYSINGIENILEVSTDNFNSILFTDTTTSEQIDTSLNLANNQVVYWRVRSFNYCYQEAVSAIWTFTFFVPSGLQGINLWLDAGNGVVLDNDSNVVYWKNLVDLTDTTYQSIVDNRPSFVAQNPMINNKPCFSFDGTDDILENINNHTFGAAFILSRWAGQETTFPDYNGLMATYNTTPYYYIFIGDKNTSNIYISVPWLDNLYVNDQHTSDFSPIDRYKILYGETNNPQVVPGFVVGSANHTWGFWNGEIAEILAFDQAPTDSVKNIIYNYFRGKYAPPVNLGPNINVAYGFCDTTIHAGTRFTNFQWYKDGISLPGAAQEYISASSPGGWYKVVATDIFGFKSTDSVLVTYPSAVLSIADTTICLGSTITISSPLSSQEGYTYAWSNDSTTASISISGPATISLTVTDTLAQHCSAVSNSITVAIDSFANHISLGNNIVLCAGNKISLTYYPENSATLTFLWSDNSHDSLFTVTASGDYWVSVTNSRGCSGMDTIHVDTLGTAPLVNFTADTVCLGVPVIFQNLSASSYDSLVWNFGDGDTTSAFNPQHQYSIPDTYMVTLTEFVSVCFNTFSKQVVVKPVPVAGFSYSPSCAGFLVDFTNTSTPQGSGAITGYLWNFAGLQTSSNANPSFTFDNQGNYPVSLLVTSSNGCFDTITRVVNTVTSVTLPDISLVQPGNHTLVSNNPVHFSWYSINGIENILEVSTDNFNSILFTDTTTSEQIDTTLNLTNNQVVYWRVRSFNYCYQEAVSAIWTFTFFVPSGLQGINLWLDAGNGVVLDNDSNVVYWKNLVDLTDTTYQSIVDNRPSFIPQNPMINNKPCFSFDSSKTTILENVNNHKFGAAFILSRWVGTETAFPKFNGLMATYNTSPYYYIFIGNKHSSDMYVSTSTAWSDNIYVNNHHSLDYSPLDRYKILYGETTSPQVVPGFIVGSAIHTDNFWNGEIAEILAFDQAPTDSVKNIIYNYFRDKYAPPR